MTLLPAETAARDPEGVVIAAAGGVGGGGRGGGGGICGGPHVRMASGGAVCVCVGRVFFYLLTAHEGLSARQGCVLACRAACRALQRPGNYSPVKQKTAVGFWNSRLHLSQGTSCSRGDADCKKKQIKKQEGV